MIQVLKNFIFWSRWLQAPLYLGLIVAQGVYVYQFMIELSHLVAKAGRLTDTDIMLIVLGLIDVVMIANLLNIHRLVLKGAINVLQAEFQAS